MFQKIKKNKLILILTISLAFNIFFAVFFINKSQNKLATTNNENISASTNNKTSVFPASNIEWFNLYSKLSAGGLNEFVITWKTQGTVNQISDKPGDKPGFNDYYTGDKKGYFHYSGKITLAYTNNKKIEWALSDRRMQLLKVYDITPSGPVEKTFQDIKVGDNIEIEESVDLSISNINDENVRYLVIRIF